MALKTRPVKRQIIAILWNNWNGDKCQACHVIGDPRGPHERSDMRDCARFAILTILQHEFEEASFIQPMLIALAPMWQTSSKADTFLRKAKQQVSQYDIMQNLIQAIDELTREVKRIDNEVRRVRRDVQVKRRF